MGFFPEGYSVPESNGNYFKFEQNANRFRIMSAPTIGWVYWTVDKKPIRSREYPENMKDARPDGKVKHFWALVVWNYKVKKLQILELTQATIQRNIEELVLNEDYGDPTGYDITITKKGEGLDTEYTLVPHPPKGRPIEAVTAFRKVSINLEALYSGADPFAPGAIVEPEKGIEYPTEGLNPDAIDEAFEGYEEGASK